MTLVSGGTPSKSRIDFWGGEVPWVTCKDMKAPRLYGAEDHLTALGAANGTRIAPPGTVLIVVRGMILAQRVPVAIAMGNLAFNQDLKALRCAASIRDDFLFYWLLANEYLLLAIADEAAHGTKRLQTDRLLNLGISVPPLPIQRKIAAILSAYDGLIENNTRRIAILEEMARLLYREWFVDFRFPGHESVPMVRSPLGPIPQGWKASTIGNACDVTMGQSPPSRFYNTSREGLPFHQGVTNFGWLFPRHKVYCTLASRVAEPWDSLVSVRAPVGRINVADTRLVIGRGVASVRSREARRAFTLYQLREYFSEEDSMGGGTIFKAITKQDLLGVPFLLPNEESVGSFEDVVLPMMSLLRVLDESNTNLRQTRDLLLPRLIPGEIDVADLDINTEGLAA